MVLLFIWLTGAIIFFIVVLLLIAQMLVLLLRALVWLIVEYNKGVWGAIMLLCTIILGIIELYLKGK